MTPLLVNILTKNVVILGHIQARTWSNITTFLVALIMYSSLVDYINQTGFIFRNFTRVSLKCMATIEYEFIVKPMADKR